jgi:primosomal replication protein N
LESPIQGLYRYSSVGNWALVVFHSGFMVEMDFSRQVQSKIPFQLAY